MTEPKTFTSISTLKSRVHKLRSFPPGCYVKRDDELGFGVSGTKVRKYLSYLPSLLSEKPTDALLIGSAYSNHVLSFSQQLVEHGVQPILFLLGDEKCKLEGNFLYTSLIAGTENIHWIPRSKWNEVDRMAEEYAMKKRAEGRRVAIVPKGANCAASLPGAMTLGQDILRNEREMGLEFDHIVMDSGTGLSACALILFFALLKRSTFLHVVLVAGGPEEFMGTLALRKRDWEELSGEQLASLDHFKLYTPTSAKAFGAVNAKVFETVADIARKEGFLVDPVFTAKLFLEGKKILSNENLQGNTLFIHSGGGLGLSGFQTQLANWV